MRTTIFISAIRSNGYFPIHEHSGGNAAHPSRPRQTNANLLTYENKIIIIGYLNNRFRLVGARRANEKDDLRSTKDGMKEGVHGEDRITLEQQTREPPVIATVSCRLYPRIVRQKSERVVAIEQVVLPTVDLVDGHLGGLQILPAIVDRRMLAIEERADVDNSGLSLLTGMSQCHDSEKTYRTWSIHAKALCD